MKKWKKLIVLLLCLLFVQAPLVNLAVPAQAAGVKTGLKKENGKYYFYNSKGVKVKSVWKSIKASDGKTYRYYFGKDGAAYQGTKSKALLKKIGGYYYAFTSTGRAIVGTKAAPKLKKIGTDYYAFNSAGQAVVSKWKKINGSYYYFNAKGIALKGTKSYGVTIPLVKTVNGKKYAFGPTGKRLSGTYVIDNKFYTFNSKTGIFNAAVTQKLRNAAVSGKPASALKNILNVYVGKANKEKVEGDSCMGIGKDVNWYYTNFIVGVFRPSKGAETVVSVIPR